MVCICFVVMGGGKLLLFLWFEHQHAVAERGRRKEMKDKHQEDV